MGRLLEQLKCMQTESGAASGLSAYISGAGFDSIIESIQVISGFTEDENNVNIFTIPSLALRLGHTLIKLAHIKRGLGLRKNDDDKTKNEAEAFLNLMADEWNDRISAIALASIKLAKYKKPNLLPVTSDLVMLRKYLDVKIGELCEQLKANPNYSSWKELAKIVLCKVVLFNKCRGNEEMMSPRRMILVVMSPSRVILVVMSQNIQRRIE